VQFVNQKSMIFTGLVFDIPRKENIIMKIKSFLLIFLIIAAIGVALTGPSGADRAPRRIAFDAQSILPPQLLEVGYTQIEMPYVSMNYGEGYSGATSCFTAPRSGVYQFNANVSVDTGGQDCSAFILSLFLNGNEHRRLSRTEWGHQFEMAGSGLLALSKNEIVDIWVFHNCPSPVVVEANGKAYFNGAFLYR
jgi:hypothetical protein